MNTHNHPLVDREGALETCNSLMRGELTAAETYRQALQRLGVEAPEDLTTCLHSHDQRAALLAEHLTLAGGTPVGGRGLWSAFARLVDMGPELSGPRALYATLEDGEDQALTDYRTALANLDGPGLLLLRRELLPEQVRTHGLMSALCRRCS